MAVIDWWNGPLILVVIFFALCLLLLTWSIAGVACRACHSSGTFFHCDTHTHTHTHRTSPPPPPPHHTPHTRARACTHTHGHTHACVSRWSWRASVWNDCLNWCEACVLSQCIQKHEACVSQRYRLESLEGIGHFSRSCHQLYLSSFSDTHTHFLGRSLLYIEFFLSVVHELEFFFFSFQDV